MLNPEFSPTAYRMRDVRLKLEVQNGICPHCGSKDVMGKPFCYSCKQYKNRPAAKPAAVKPEVNGNGHHAEAVFAPASQVLQEENADRTEIK